MPLKMSNIEKQNTRKNKTEKGQECHLKAKSIQRCPAEMK